MKGVSHYKEPSVEKTLCEGDIFEENEPTLSIAFKKEQLYIIENLKGNPNTNLSEVLIVL